MGEVILDVRERDEFEAEHIGHSINVPLSSFASVAPGILNDLREREVLIMCRSGNRAKLAAAQIEQLGYADKVSARVYEGGILAWRGEGKPTVRRKRSHFPVLRQVQLVVGISVLVTSILGALVNPWFLAITTFFGAGLTVAGATGFCGMAQVLALMPWNRTCSATSGELRLFSPKASCAGSDAERGMS